MRTKYKSASLACMLLIILVSCKRITPELVAVEGKKPVASRVISGYVSYVDPYNGRQLPVAEKPVVIRNDQYPDIPFYLDTALTDKNGFFSVTVPDSTKTYTIVVNADIKTSTDTIIAYGGETIFPPSAPNGEKIVLQPVAIPRVLSVIAADELAGTIPGATILLYTSRVLAQTDSNMTGFGKFDQKTTNSIGTALFANVPDDSIFIRAYLRINDSTILKNGISAFKASGINDTVAVTLK